MRGTISRRCPRAASVRSASWATCSWLKRSSRPSRTVLTRPGPARAAGPLDAAVREAVSPSLGPMALLRGLRDFDRAGVCDRAAAEVAARDADRPWE